MRDRGKHNILGVGIDAVDYEAAVARITGAAHVQQPLAVTALAVHGTMTGVLDTTQLYRLNHFDLVVPDGQPVRWALNWLHHTGLTDRVYGPTLMLRVCAAAADVGLPIYLYGSNAGVLAALQENLQKQFPALVIAGAEPSQFRCISVEESAATARRIKASGARIVFVGLGCPRQEVWAYEYRGVLSMPLLAVGAAFDFHAGTVRQAPLVLQRWGLEWTFRFAQEPRRLWRRYALNPLYLALLVVQGLGLHQFDPAHATAPESEVRYG